MSVASRVVMLMRGGGRGLVRMPVVRRMVAVVLWVGRFLVFLLLVLFEQSLFLFQLFKVRYGGRIGDRLLWRRLFGTRGLVAGRLAAMVVLMRAGGGRRITCCLFAGRTASRA